MSKTLKKVQADLIHKMSSLRNEEMRTIYFEHSLNHRNSLAYNHILQNNDKFKKTKQTAFDTLLLARRFLFNKL